MTCPQGEGCTCTGCQIETLGQELSFQLRAAERWKALAKRWWTSKGSMATARIISSARKAERARIVAALRKQASKIASERNMSGVSVQAYYDLSKMAKGLLDVADAIERGQL